MNDKELKAQYHDKLVKVEINRDLSYTGKLYVYTDDGSFFGTTSVEMDDCMGNRIKFTPYIVECLLSGDTPIQILAD